MRLDLGMTHAEWLRWFGYAWREIGLRADEHRRAWWRDFAELWRNVGRPFSKCVYCEQWKLGHFPGEKYDPAFHCTAEQFVLSVVYSFPMLRRDCPGLTPWKPEKWARWWRTSWALTSGSKHAVAFCLSLWAGHNADHWKRRGWSFDVVEAFGCWDHNHRQAFLRWANSPSPYIP